MSSAPVASSHARGLVFSQSTGELTLDGHVIGRGYSGRGAGRNNPDLQMSHALGPIPQGRYTVGRQFHSAVTGPGAMRLTPMPGTQTFGRGSFEMHGDSLRHPGDASEGCIILAPLLRRRIDLLPNRTLTVVR